MNYCLVFRSAHDRLGVWSVENGSFADMNHKGWSRYRFPFTAASSSFVK